MYDETKEVFNGDESCLAAMPQLSILDAEVLGDEDGTLSLSDSFSSLMGTSISSSGSMHQDTVLLCWLDLGRSVSSSISKMPVDLNSSSAETNSSKTRIL